MRLRAFDAEKILRAAAVADPRRKHAPIPRGWITVWDECERIGCSYTWTAHRLHTEFRKGLRDRRAIPNPAGPGSPAYIYGPKRHEKGKGKTKG